MLFKNYLISILIKTRFDYFPYQGERIIFLQFDGVINTGPWLENIYIFECFIW